MKYNIKNKGFSDISLAKYYNSVGDVVKILYKVSTSQLFDYDILETNFKYLSEKSKFSDHLPLEYLTSEDKDRIGSDLITLEKYYLTLFPTQVSVDSDSSIISYFGSIVNQNYELITFIVPEGIERLELFSESSSSPDIEIEFLSGSAEQGKDEINSQKVVYIYLTYTEPGKSWVELDNWEGSIDYESEDIPEIEAEIGEVCYVTSLGKYYRYLRSGVSINLSYISWSLDNNSNPKMSDYALRRDFYNGYESPVSTRGDGMLYSHVSGTLLGTIPGANPTLLGTRTSGTLWNRNRVYGLGEEVTVQLSGQVYESLTNHNIGNHPLFSNAWIKKNQLRTFLNKQIQIIISSNDERDYIPGTVSPSGTISIPQIYDNYTKTFTYTTNPGYFLEDLYGQDPETPLIKSMSGDYWKYETVGPSGELVYKIELTKNAWPKIADRLSFVYSLIKGKLNLCCINSVTKNFENMSASDLTKLPADNSFDIINLVKPSLKDYLYVYDVTEEEVEIDPTNWKYGERIVSNTETTGPDTSIGINTMTPMKIVFQSRNLSVRDYKAKETITAAEFIEKVIVAYEESNTIQYKEITDVELETISISGTTYYQISFYDTYSYSTKFDTEYTINTSGGKVSPVYSTVTYPMYYILRKPLVEAIVINNLLDYVMVNAEYAEVTKGGSYTIYFYLTREISDAEEPKLYNGSSLIDPSLVVYDEITGTYSYTIQNIKKPITITIKT